jgi:hypothetical protein
MSYYGESKTDDWPSTAFFYVVPIGMIQAITNQQVGLK